MLIFTFGNIDLSVLARFLGSSISLGSSGGADEDVGGGGVGFCGGGVGRVGGVVVVGFGVFDVGCTNPGGGMSFDDCCCFVSSPS